LFYCIIFHMDSVSFFILSFVPVIPFSSFCLLHCIYLYHSFPTPVSHLWNFGYPVITNLSLSRLFHLSPSLLVRHSLTYSCILYTTLEPQANEESQRKSVRYRLWDCFMKDMAFIFNLPHFLILTVYLQKVIVTWKHLVYLIYFDSHTLKQ
jgi:hypothetical protein